MFRETGQNYYCMTNRNRAKMSVFVGRSGTKWDAWKIRRSGLMEEKNKCS